MIYKLTNKKTTRIENATIRLITESEKFILLDFANSIFEKMDSKEFWGGMSKENIEEFLAQPNCIYACFVENKIVAFAVYMQATKVCEEEYNLNNPLNSENTILVQGVMVEPDYRGNKLQQTLIKIVEKRAKSNSKKYLFATVHPNNSHSLNNLLSCGFKILCEKNLHYGRRLLLYKKI